MTTGLKNKKSKKILYIANSIILNSKQKLKLEKKNICKI